MIKTVDTLLLALRKKKPLILNLTNYVTMEFVANALLAIGAAPIMSVCDTELEELINMSSCININIGTLDDVFIERCHQAAMLAKHAQKPIILDPVGAGATHIRTKTAQGLMKYADIIRGNASEIIALHKNRGTTLGVESLNSSDEAKDIAIQIAKDYDTTVVVTGKVDFITDGKDTTENHFGSPLMPLVTGMGCALNGIIAAFRSLTPSSFESAQLAVSYFGLCGSIAEKKAKHPGSFRTTFIDLLHSADLTDV